MPVLGIAALAVGAVLFFGWPREIAELQIAFRSFMYKEVPEPSAFAVAMVRVTGVVFALWAIGLALAG